MSCVAKVAGGVLPERRFNSYSQYFRELMGTRVQKVAINAGFTCPNRDGTVGTGGCTFCNNEAFTPSYCTPSKSITTQIDEGIEFHSRRYRRAEKYLAYFQSFSNTHAPLDELKRVYGEALAHPRVAGIVVGTRPDCVDEEKLDYFAELARRHYVAIEYGIESTFDETLVAINRGHDFATARRAVEMTAERAEALGRDTTCLPGSTNPPVPPAPGYGLHIGAHFILGFPGETDEMLLAQADTINSLPLTTVKFHQLQIFRDTAMATEWERAPERFTFKGMEEYIDFFIEILRRLRPSLVVERFAGEAPPRWRVGRDWGLVRNEELAARLDRRLAELDVRQGDLYEKPERR
ncbi:MAG: TIGR01212 family radical SAM protein [Alistipes sp.]|jgi:radical SAM superfamily enzyme|nr:TIGR01212 family radical SAM protein [Alistipes sp.]